MPANETLNLRPKVRAAGNPAVIDARGFSGGARGKGPKLLQR
jgi:hypothetical protein